MPNLKKYLLPVLMMVLFISGCTQVVTAPIYVAGAVVTTTIDVAGAAVNAVKDDDEENTKEKD